MPQKKQQQRSHAAGQPGRPHAGEEAKAVLTKIECPNPECGSSDAFTYYDDGHGYCFSEGKLYGPGTLRSLGFAPALERAEQEGNVQAHSRRQPPEPATQDIEQFLASGAKAHPIKSRELSLASCRRWGYLARRNPHKHTVEHVAQYYDHRNRIVALKVRTEEPKGFRWIGKPEKAGLYGQNLWGSSGKILTITEGEIDAITVSQCFDHKYPVVSVRNGAASALKDITAELEWINTFEKVVLMFDMDEPGQEAAHEVASVIAPGKAFIAHLSEKDANECLLRGKAAEITGAIWNAKPYRPEGVVDARALTQECLAPVTIGIPWPWPFMTKWTFGRRYGEVYTFGSGTGMGKSDFMGEIIAGTIAGVTKDGQRYTPEGCALFNFEAGAARTKKLVAGKLASRRFHIPNMEGEPPHWTQEELIATMNTMDTTLWDAGGKLFINDSKLVCDWEGIKNKCRFYRHADGVRHFVIDPVGAIVADSEDDRQVQLLDRMFRQASLLAQELDACLYMVSHLTRPSFGPSHEEGGHVRLSQFRGSNGIGMFSNYVIGMERNQQAETEIERTKAIVRVVKDRYTGNATGETHALHYDRMAGTLDVENTGLGTTV